MVQQQKMVFDALVVDADAAQEEESSHLRERRVDERTEDAQMAEERCEHIWTSCQYEGREVVYCGACLMSYDDMPPERIPEQISPV